METPALYGCSHGVEDAGRSPKLGCESEAFVKKETYNMDWSALIVVIVGTLLFAGFAVGLGFYSRRRTGMERRGAGADSRAEP